MRKIAIAAVLTLASVLAGYADTLAGVTLPDSVKAGEATLVLNGLGLRKKFVVKVYVAGLYLEKKSSDANAILNAEEPKRVVLHFVHDVSKQQMADAFRESFSTNSPDVANKLKADIDRFLEKLEPLKDGDELAVTYVPGTGTTLAINGNDKITIAGAEFGRMVFAVWLGPKPPNADLKQGLLGQRH